MNEYKRTVETLIQKMDRDGLEHEFKPASPSEIAYLKKAEYPNSVITFYESYEPVSCIEYNEIRLWNIKELEIENTQATPGYTIFPFGYRVIATTLYGDVLVVNSNEENGPVNIASHDEIEEDTKEEEIKDKIIKIANSFEDFLAKFTNKDIKSRYYDYENA
jgi:hypothetical protein